MAYALSKAEAVCKEIQVRENIKKNQAAFSANDQTSPWRDNLLSPNAVMGGVRNMEKPVVLYKAASKRVTLYSRDTYALELNGVGEFGAYYLSKHIFNLSFLHDPFFRRSNPTKKRQSIEVLYQLGNYHQHTSETGAVGLFPRPTLILTDQITFADHGWLFLQQLIHDLTNDLEISLPDCSKHAKDGWFVPLPPFPGHKKPFPGAEFVTAMYDQLRDTGYLEEIEEAGEKTYRHAQSPPVIESSSTFNDDWRFQYGRVTPASQIKSELEWHVQTMQKDVVLHVNSFEYYGPLTMFCYGCGDHMQYRRENLDGIDWYDLHRPDPRSALRQTTSFCDNCQEGE